MNKKKFFSIVILLVIGIFYYIYAVPKIKGNYSRVNHSNFRCGKIETPDGDYTIKIPKKYAYFPFSYSGESIWDPSTQVKKENPCLFPISGGSFAYIWPSLSPYGKLPYYRDQPDLVRISIDLLKWPEINTSEEHQKKKQNSLKVGFIFDWKILKEEYEDFDIKKIIKDGTYDSELQLYRKERIVFEDYRFDQSERYKKVEAFWKTDKSGDLDVVIVCDYQGYDPLKIPFSEAMCTQYQYNDKLIAKIKIRYLGKHINDWKKVEAETDRFLNEFITQKEK